MFFAQFLGGRDIEKRIGFAIELQQILLGHAITLAPWVIAAKGPFPLKAMRLKDGGYGCDIVGGIGSEFIALGMIDPPSGVFNIIDVVTQAPKANEVMQELIGHPGQRIPKDDSKNDDFAFDATFIGHIELFPLFQMS
jgi:hypothetical protein